MPVRIRLARHGRKSRPYYYIVVADSRAPRDGKFIERIGSYNPVTNPATLELDFDKALEWIQKGAQPSDTARSLLQQKGVMYKNHLLKGVLKGALTEEEAEKKFQEWISQKESELSGIAQKIKADIESEQKARLAAESKIRESMAAELARKRSELVAAETEGETAEAEAEAAEGQSETQETPAPEDAPAAEEPAAEKAEEPAAEKAEEPAAEKAEEPAADKAEEPAADKAEEPAAEKAKAPEKEKKAETTSEEDKTAAEKTDDARDDAKDEEKGEDKKSE